MPRTTVRSSLADQAFQGAAEGLERGGHGQQSLDHLNGVGKGETKRAWDHGCSASPCGHTTTTVVGRAGMAPGVRQVWTV